MILTHHRSICYNWNIEGYICSYMYLKVRVRGVGKLIVCACQKRKVKVKQEKRELNPKNFEAMLLHYH
jgi:hypothetical protein